MITLSSSTLCTCYSWRVLRVRNRKLIQYQNNYFQDNLIWGTAGSNWWNILLISGRDAGRLRDKNSLPVSGLSTLLWMWHLENDSAVATLKKLDISIDWYSCCPAITGLLQVRPHLVSCVKVAVVCRDSFCKYVNLLSSAGTWAWHHPPVQYIWECHTGANETVIVVRGLFTH